MSYPLLLGLGTNLGDRRQNLRRAVRLLGEVMRLEAVSAVYETDPWGKSDQPSFLNLCLAGTTDFEPRPLLEAVKALEVELGRQPAERWGPRLIDIDLLFMDDIVLDEPGLSLPHPTLHKRPFVLAPLADVAPDCFHPLLQRSVVEMLAAIGSNGVTQLAEPLFRNPSSKPVNVLPWDARTYVMGILNVTPDSFSGDGLMRQYDWPKAAARQAESFVAAGADILDIGGESTRPGSTPITAEEEQARLLPALAAVRQAVTVPISVDTYRASVAEAALAAGADWINDVWGLRMDPAMAGLVAAEGCPVVIMHNRSKPKNVAQEVRLGGRYVGIDYDDLIGDVSRELLASVGLALAAGVRPSQIILDPGVGFGKSVAQNAQLIDELHRIRALGYPVLVGTSRKSFIGYTLDLPPEERLEGTAATVAIAIDRGADIIRVHDVQAMARVARMTDHIVRPPAS